MMPAGLLYSGVDVNDAPQRFSNNVTVDGTTTTNGPTVHNGTVAFNGATTVGTQNLATASAQAGPADYGLLAWTHDPVLNSGTHLTIAGTQYLSAVYLRATTTLSKAWIYVTAAASALTSGQNFVGLYNSAGTQVAATADITTTLGTNTGYLSFNLATPYPAPAGMYWVAPLFNAGTTLPTLGSAAASAAQANGPLTAATSRFAVNGTSLTALAASITPASNTNTGAFTYWAAVS